MDNVIKAAALLICGAILSLLLKKDNPSFSTVLILSVCSAVLYLAVNSAKEITETVFEIADEANVPSVYLSAIFKAVGIAIVSRISADICKDAGQSAAASTMELMGAFSAVIIALPLINTVMKMLGELI